MATWQNRFVLTRKNISGGDTLYELQEFTSTNLPQPATLNIRGDMQPINFAFSDTDNCTGILSANTRLRILNLPEVDVQNFINNTAANRIRLRISVSTNPLESPSVFFIGVLDRDRVNRPLKTRNPATNYTTGRPYEINLNFVNPLSIAKKTPLSVLRRLVNDSTDITHSNSALPVVEFVRFMERITNNLSGQHVVTFFEASYGIEQTLRRWLHRTLWSVGNYDSNLEIGTLLRDLVDTLGLKLGFSVRYRTLLWFDYLTLTNGANPFVDDSQQINFDASPYRVDFVEDEYPRDTGITLNEQIVPFTEIIMPSDNQLLYTLEQLASVQLSAGGSSISRYNNSTALTTFKDISRNYNITAADFSLIPDETVFSWQLIGKSIWDPIEAIPGTLYNAAISLANLRFTNREKLAISVNRLLDPIIPVRFTVPQYGLQPKIYQIGEGSWDVIKLVTNIKNMRESGQLEQSMEFGNRTGAPFSQWIWSDQ